MNQDKFDIEYKGSLILPNACIDGHIKSVQDIWLEGKIGGDVHCEGKVIVNKCAQIDGDVECAELHSNGLITGNVSVTGKTVIGGNGVVKGRITTSVLEVTPGARINGGLRLRKASNKK